MVRELYLNKLVFKKEKKHLCLCLRGYPLCLCPPTPASALVIVLLMFQEWEVGLEYLVGISCV